MIARDRVLHDADAKLEVRGGFWNPNLTVGVGPNMVL